MYMQHLPVILMVVVANIVWSDEGIDIANPLNRAGPAVEHPAHWNMTK
jgi:hypothetical protein